MKTLEIYLRSQNKQIVKFLLQPNSKECYEFNKEDEGIYLEFYRNQKMV